MLDDALRPSPPFARHVVAFDGARKLSSTNALTLSCTGSAAGCGCVDITGFIAGSKGSKVGCGSAIYGASNVSTSAEFDYSECRVQAVVEIDEISEGGMTTIKGGGALVFSGGGEYLLPADVQANVEVHSASAAVFPQWEAEVVGSMNVTSGGVLWFAGGQRNQ